MIALLNALFDAQATAIAGHGGEILKFIGDGLLAIFPIEHADKAATAARNALAAAMQAVEAARGLMHDPSLVDEPPLEIVVALHIGTAIYGNIGAADRLDFTVIGPAVNLVSRIEAVAKALTSRSSSVTISRAPMAGRCIRSAVMSFAGSRHLTICSRQRSPLLSRSAAPDGLPMAGLCRPCRALCKSRARLGTSLVRLSSMIAGLAMQLGAFG